uniref:Ig-like domain-containing protein n=1 Tax=Oreochromis niloticus TaxID=8128 RepID=A0A669CIQ1_ORENI
MLKIFSSKSICLPLISVFIFLLTVFVAQRVEVSPEVTGYLGHDVTLHCQLIQGPTHTNIAHVQWFLLEEGGTGKKKVALIAFNSVFGVNIFESPLKERVAFNEHSLIIKDVKMKDAGSYTCEITTFPSGTFEGTTKLVVQGKDVNCFYILSQNNIRCYILGIIRENLQKITDTNHTFGLNIFFFCFMSHSF